MTVREAALRLLCEYESSGKYVNLSLSSHIADRFTKEERSFLTVLLYTSVERKLTYDYYISAIGKRSIDSVDMYTRNILRLGFCQILSLEAVPPFAAVNETVKLARNKGEAGFVNGILRAALRLKENNSLPLPDREKSFHRYLSVRESFPLPLVRLLSEKFGDSETEQMLRAFNEKRTTTLTVNTLKISTEEYISLLEEAGFKPERSEISERAVLLPESVSPKNLAGYEEGYFFVQDEACSALAEALNASEGDEIVDTCSAPGGKAFAAAIFSGDRAKIHAFDIHESKLSLIESGAKRLGLSSVIAKQRDATSPDGELFGKIDGVICDVPCSGLGVLGKKPDLRYKSIESIKDLPEIQYSILSASKKYLKVGGRLVYSTCTLLDAENEAVVRRFLDENPDFAPAEFEAGKMKSNNGMMTFLPHKTGTDGFFIALLERKR